MLASIFPHFTLSISAVVWSVFLPLFIIVIASSHSSRTGGKVCGASPAYNVEEMSFALKTADARFLFTVPNSLDVAISAAANAGIPQAHIFLLEGKAKGFTTVQDLIAIGKRCGQEGQSLPHTIPKDKKNGEVCGFLCFSSGTTGLPKAVSS
jgi:4-coumarate--CoA ligase